MPIEKLVAWDKMRRRRVVKNRLSPPRRVIGCADLCPVDLETVPWADLSQRLWHDSTQPH